MRTLADEAKRDATWALLGVFFGAWVAVKSSPWIGLPFVGLFLAQALLLWNRKVAGVYLAFATVVLGMAAFSWLMITKGFTPGRAAIVGVLLFSTWAYWSSYGDLLRGRAAWDDPEDEADRRAAREREEADDSKPLTSIVLLRATPKFLDAPVLLECVRDAWDERRELSDEELFVAGESPIFLIKSPQGMWMVHNHPRPYFDGESPAEKMSELRLRKALDDHAAWVSVDLMHGFLGDLPTEIYYPYIFRLIRELADDDTLAIFRPETGHINIWNDEVARSLGSIDPLEEFAAPVHSPVISVSDDDPRMLAAVAEARQTFGTFRAHWAGRRPDDSFLIKAALRQPGNSEVIWIEVTGLEPEFVHGTLANEPVDLDGLHRGDRVEVPIGDLYDWAIAQTGAEGPLGLFTDKVVREVQREAREASRGSGDPAKGAQA